MSNSVSGVEDYNIKTLHVVPYYLPSDSPNSSGVKESTLTLISGLCKRGVVSLVMLPAPSAHDQDFASGGFKVAHFHDPRHLVLHRQDFSPLGLIAYGSRIPQYARALRREIRDWRIDLVHNQSSAFPVPGMVARLLGLPCVTHVRESGFRLGSVQNAIFLRAVPKISDHVICCADYIRKEFLAAGAPPNKVTTIYNAVDLHRFEGVRRRNLREALGMRSDQQIVGYVGRIAPRKGIEYFIQAAALVGQEFSDAFFLIIGDISENEEVPYLASLKNIAKKTTLGDRLRFLGNRQDIPEVMGTLDLLVFPSPNDIGPRVPIEAMAAGTPVISASIGGAQEEVVDGVTGLHVEPKDPQAIGSAIVRLLRDRELRRTFGIQAAEHVRRHYDQEQYVESVLEVYKKVLRKKGRIPDTRAGHPPP